jgi:hypothetical protein
MPSSLIEKITDRLQRWLKPHALPQQFEIGKVICHAAGRATARVHGAALGLAYTDAGTL